MDLCIQWPEAQGRVSSLSEGLTVTLPGGKVGKANKGSSKSYVKYQALETEQVGWQKPPKVLQKPAYSTDCSSIEEICPKEILQLPWVWDPK